jgi:hypothetical protein
MRLAQIYIRKARGGTFALRFVKALHPVTEIAIPRHSKANWLNLRGVFHGDVCCVTNAKPRASLLSPCTKCLKAKNSYLPEKYHLEGIRTTCRKRQLCC